MLPQELSNVIIALRSKDDRIFLGYHFSLPSESVSGYLPDQLFRLIDFNIDSHTLYLKPEGRAPENAYQESFVKYSDLLEALDIERIVIRSSRISIFNDAIPKYNAHVISRPQYQPPQQPNYNQLPKPPVPPPSTHFTETLNFDIRDALFDDGTIKFQVKLKSKWQIVDTTINNPSVKKYFDSVKNYIWKLFGSKKTSCSITFDLQNGKYVPISVNSCDLLTLDESILQNIQDGWVDQVIVSSDREDILPIEELIQSVKDETLNGESIFNHLVQEVKTEHYHHLRYLSAKQSIDLQKLSITGKPLSFVFVIRENGNIFLVWETYLTKEATYIWKLSTAAEIQNKFGLILELRKGNRMSYRRKKEAGFFFIEHDYQEQKMNGFLKWKEALENIIENNPLTITDTRLV